MHIDDEEKLYKLSITYKPKITLMINPILQD